MALPHLTPVSSHDDSSDDNSVPIWGTRGRRFRWWPLLPKLRACLSRDDDDDEPDSRVVYDDDDDDSHVSWHKTRVPVLKQVGVAEVDDSTRELAPFSTQIAPAPLVSSGPPPPPVSTPPLPVVTSEVTVATPWPPRPPSSRAHSTSLLRAPPRANANRARADSNHTNQTSGSKHRRHQASFCFSVVSLQQILNENSTTNTNTNTNKVPCAMIQCLLQRDCSELLMEDDYLLSGVRADDDVDFFVSTDSEHDDVSRSAAPPDWMWSWAQAGATDNKMAGSSPVLPDPVTHSARTTVDTLDTTVSSPITYLPYSSAVCLGWMVVSRGPLTLRPWQHDDIQPVGIVRQHDGGPIQLTLGPDELDLARVFVQSVLVSPEWGRAVVLCHVETKQVVCTLLPVSLPPVLFQHHPNSTRLDEINLGTVGFTTPVETDVWATGDTVARYAPEEQHDAAMNLLFRIDTLLFQKNTAR